MVFWVETSFSNFRVTFNLHPLLEMGMSTMDKSVIPFRYHISGCQLERLSRAEIGISLGHRILLNKTSIVVKKSMNRHCLIRQATETRRAGLSLSRSWQRLIHSLKEW
jgi:hypothetical protein